MQRRPSSPGTGWPSCTGRTAGSASCSSGSSSISAIAGRGTPLARATSIAALLAVVQVGLGIATVLLRLDPPIRAAHAAVGYALWAGRGVDRGEIGRREPPHRRRGGRPSAMPEGAPCLGLATAEREASGRIAVFARIGAYAELSKFGIVLLVLVSAAAGFMLTAPLGPDLPLARRAC